MATHACPGTIPDHPRHQNRPLSIGLVHLGLILHVSPYGLDDSPESHSKGWDLSAWLVRTRRILRLALKTHLCSG